MTASNKKAKPVEESEKPKVAKPQKKITKKRLTDEFASYRSVCQNAVESLVHVEVIPNPGEQLFGKKMSDLCGATLIDLAATKNNLPVLCKALCQAYLNYENGVEPKKREPRKKKKAAVAEEQDAPVQEQPAQDAVQPEPVAAQ